MAFKHLICLSTILQCISADWQFLSRPDLAPPRLNITVPASPQADSGYIFVTPNAYVPEGIPAGTTVPEQAGAYIFRNDGELVWSGVGYLAGFFVADFGPTLIAGKPALHAFQGSIDGMHGWGYGHHVILNNRYQTISTIRAASHRLGSFHEFNVIDGKTVIIETPISVLADLSPFGGDEGQQWIVSNGFQGSSSN